MTMKKRLFHHISVALAILLACGSAGAQELRISPQRWLLRADSLRTAYDFQGAVDGCKKAIEGLDSTRTEKAEALLALSQNGLSMTAFCSAPTVVAKRVFPLKDFFLFYPLEDRSWHDAPNPLLPDEEADIFSTLYYPEGTQDIYYSAKDENGVRNLRFIHLKDSVWTAPQPVGEAQTSAEDEIFPMLSPDGKQLFFASKGLYGMGGYDLYVCTRNEDTGGWDNPVNMGIPYSSPYDDFLFINSRDGKYSIFASNRGCQPDSVCIYVLEYDEMPVRRAVSDIGELRRLAELNPDSDPARIENGSAFSSADPVQTEASRKYMQQMKVVRGLRDSVSRFGEALDRMRATYSEVPDSDKPALAKAISDKEMLLPELNDTLSKAVSALQQIEMDFLLKGVVLDTDRLLAEADREVVGAESGYTFTKNRPGEGFELKMEEPEPTFTYEFQILPEGQFAEDNTLPRGIIYQIQMSTQSRRASVGDLNGISPVFEKRNPTGSFTYSAGAFRTFREAQANVSKVRSRGFRDAFVTAYEDGRGIPVAEARRKESVVTAFCTVKIYPADGRSLPEGTVDLIQEHTQADLIKTVEGGAVVYKVGPFDDRSAAEALASALKSASVGTVSIEED